MGKYFGTDGFRGEAGITLTADHAYKVGRFLGWYYNALRERNGDTDPARIVIGKDTRRSSYMFEYSLVAGLTASGADAYLLHVTTTPSVAYIARVDDFDCGIMISASHNPYYDNGIKLIDCYGEKMPEETLLLVEDYIDGKLHVFDKDWPELPFAHREHIGCTVDYVAGRNRYMGYLISLGIYSFKGVKVGLDCANGSSWNIAKSVFDALGADTYVINNKPNGTNINNNAGSTHIEGLQKFVVEKGLDVGFAYDGDADRCLCVDEKGNVITGDHILYIYGCYMKERGKLLNNTVVTTVMSNFGLYKAFDEQGIGYAKTAVGDKYVYEYMATHGEPSQTNAHPHVSGNCTRSGSGTVESEVVGVHNGIIENYTELKEKLLKHGYTFYSQTDTEVVIKLVDYYYKKYNLGPIDAIAKTMVRVRGSYALELMFRDYPGEIWVARKDSPMIIGIADGETYVASDVPAILKYTRNVYYIGNLEFAKLVPGEAHFYNLDGDEIEKQTTEIKWDAEAAEKGGFEHFMMKEIHEQPKAVQDTLNSVIKNGAIDLSSVEITEDEIKNFEQIYIVACGSAWHVGMAAQYVLEDIADIPVRVELASEFRYRKMPLNQKALVIVVSQSGETADTLAALRLAKEKGITTMAIVNVVGSSIAREADKVFYTLAGPEISVATTKAYSAQLAAMYCLAVQFAKVREKITEEQYSYYISELLTLPEKMQKTLEDKERIQWFAAKYANAHDVFFVGRGIDYAVCLEGSLKLKEISYIHSEAYAAGELKHGTISLIEQGTLVIGVLTQSELYEKTISNMLECKSRGAYLMGLTTYGKYEIEDQVNFTVYVPKVDEHFVGSLAVIPLQLLGYYVSVAKGLDVDKPRNLAKSVTVE